MLDIVLQIIALVGGLYLVHEGYKAATSHDYYLKITERNARQAAEFENKNVDEEVKKALKRVELGGGKKFSGTFAILWIAGGTILLLYFVFSFFI